MGLLKKRRLRPGLVFLLILIHTASNITVCAQVLSKSTGSDGKVHYSDRPNTEGRAETTMEMPSLPSNQVPGLTHSYVEQLRALKEWEADYARKNPGNQVPTRTGVVLYSASWCGYCKLAKSYLAQHKVAYQEIDVDTKGGKAEFAQVRKRGGGIPLLVAENKKVEGFTSAGYDAFFANLKEPAH